MSRMSELATALEEMTEVGRDLIACGESLLKAAAHVRACFTGDAPAAAEEEPTPVTGPATDTPAPKAYTKEEVRALLAALSQNGFRHEAKALAGKSSDGGEPDGH